MTPTAIPQVRVSGPSTRRRRLIQLGFLAVFAALPLFDLFRFDFPGKKLHVFRRDLWMDEWAIVWLALMLAMWIVGAATLVLGRVYCAYACPQMVFSELAHDVDALARRLARRLGRPPLQRAVALALLGLLSLAATVLFMGYFAPLPEVLRRLARLEVGLWVGAVGAATTLLGFLDLVFVRERFCRSVCPYGLLQGVLEDGRSLHVRFDQTTGPCIECKVCARVCPMGIDIRDGPFQIECTRCGSCVDACDAVLGKRRRTGLLAFRLGAPGAAVWDLKRVLVAISTVGFGAGLVFAVVARQPVSLHLTPVYTESGAQTGGPAESRFLLRAANRGREAVALAVHAEGLPHASVEGLGDGRVAAGREARFTLVVRVPRADVTATVTPFVWVVTAGDRSSRFPATLYAPGQSGAPPALRPQTVPGRPS